MFHLSSIATIFVYFAICAFLVGQSLFIPKPSKKGKGQTKNKAIVHEFESAQYFQKKKNISQAQLLSKELVMSDYVVKVRSPEGDVFPSENEKLHYKAEYAEYIKSRSSILLKGNVDIKHLQGDMTCDQGYLLLDKEFAQCRHNVKSNLFDLDNGDQLKVNADIVKMWFQTGRAKYQGHVKGKVLRKFSYEPGLDFDSENLTFYRSDLSAEFEGEVHFNYQGVKSRSGRAELYLENYNKELKYYVLYDDIEVEQNVTDAKGNKITRKAYSEILEAFNQQRKVVLKGAPRVVQGLDTTRGYKITLFLDREIMEVDNSSSVIKINE